MEQKVLNRVVKNVKTSCEGTIAKVEGNYMVVNFGNREAKYQFPLAFENTLVIDSPELQNELVRISKLKKWRKSGKNVNVKKPRLLQRKPIQECQ